MNRPSTSVCIPAWNAASHIERCVRSALDALDVDEVVVVDDGSTDDTCDRVLGLSDPRLRLIRHYENAGRARNIQRAFAAGTGEFVLLLPADDELLPSSITTLRELLLANADASFAFGAAEVVDESGARLRLHRPFDEPWVRRGADAVRSLLPHDPVLTTTSLVRASALAASGGLRLDIAPSHRDWDLFLRLAAGGGAAYTPTTVARDRSHPGNFTDQIRGTDRTTHFEFLILDAFDTWARAHAPEVMDAISEGRAAWAKSKLGDAILAHVGLRPTTAQVSLGLALAAHPTIRREPRFWTALLLFLIPRPFARALQPMLRRFASRELPPPVSVAPLGQGRQPHR